MYGNCDDFSLPAKLRMCQLKYMVFIFIKGDFIDKS